MAKTASKSKRARPSGMSKPASRAMKKPKAKKTGVKNPLPGPKPFEP